MYDESDPDSFDESGHPADPQPPKKPGIWIIPNSDWQCVVTFKSGQVVNLEITAPFWIFAYGIAVKTAVAMYPEGRGVKKCKVSFLRRVPLV